MLIERMLADAQIPLWDSNRPSVLIWMALQDESGSRSLMTSDINNDIIEYIKYFADARGLPVLFPVLDFEDRRNLVRIWFGGWMNRPFELPASAMVPTVS